MPKFRVTVEVSAKDAKDAKRIVGRFRNPPKSRKPTLVAAHMEELINFGGLMMSRGEAYQELMAIAKAQGHSASDARVLADRWMQGYDRKRS